MADRQQPHENEPQTDRTPTFIEITPSSFPRLECACAAGATESEIGACIKKNYQLSILNPRVPLSRFVCGMKILNENLVPNVRFHNPLAVEASLLLSEEFRQFMNKNHSNDVRFEQIETAMFDDAFERKMY